MINIHYFDAENLISFGNYLLSDARTERVLNHPETDLTHKEQALKEVSHADVLNWFESQPVQLSGL